MIVYATYQIGGKAKRYRAVLFNLYPPGSCQSPDCSGLRWYKYRNWEYAFGNFHRHLTEWFLCLLSLIIMYLALYFIWLFFNSFILGVYLYYVLQEQTSMNGNFKNRLGPSLWTTLRQNICIYTYTHGLASCLRRKIPCGRACTWIVLHYCQQRKFFLWTLPSLSQKKPSSTFMPSEAVLSQDNDHHRWILKV